VSAFAKSPFPSAHCSSGLFQLLGPTRTRKLPLTHLCGANSRPALALDLQCEITAAGGRICMRIGFGSGGREQMCLSTCSLYIVTVPGRMGGSASADISANKRPNPSCNRAIYLSGPNCLHSGRARAPDTCEDYIARAYRREVIGPRKLPLFSRKLATAVPTAAVLPGIAI
jgi:hypothetical protein